MFTLIVRLRRGRPNVFFYSDEADEKGGARYVKRLIGCKLSPGPDACTLRLPTFSAPVRNVAVAGKSLVGNRAYPTIVADYENTFAKLSKMKADIVLTSRRGPKALHEVAGRAKQDFDATLAEAGHQVPVTRR